MRSGRVTCFLGLLFLFLPALAFAVTPTTYVVTLNTASLSGTAGSLDFNFNPGPLSTQTATLTVGGFASDGKLTAAPAITGDVTGTLPASLQFDNGKALNEYFAPFTFGSTLTFQVTVSGSAISAPDGLSTSGSAFAFSIFSDAAGSKPIFTTDLTDGFGFTLNANLNGTTTPTTYLTNVGTVLVAPVFTASPSAQTINPSQTVTVAVSATGPGGYPTPTGSFTLSSGSYTSAAATLASGTANIVVPAASLVLGLNTVTATYTGDTVYAKASVATTVTVAQLAPAVAVTPTPAAINPSQGLSVVVAVNGGNGNPVPTGNVTLVSGGYTSAATNLSSGYATISIPAGTLALGADTLTASYSGDTTFAKASGTASVTDSQLTPMVAVTPTPAAINPSQGLSIAVAVNGGAGNPAPSGTVTLTSGSYTSAATTLSSGLATISIPAGALALGPNVLTASYAGNTTYAKASGTANVTDAQLTPTVAVTPTPVAINTSQGLSVAMALNGGSGNPVPTGTVTLTSGSYTSAAITLSGGVATISIPAGTLPLGTDTLTASYSGDSTYTKASGAATVPVTVPPGLTLSTSAASVTSGSATGNTTSVTVTPLGGFTGSVSLTAALTSSPSGAVNPPTFSFGSTNPVTVAGVAPVSATLTINTSGAGSASLRPPLQPRPWELAGTVSAAFVLLFTVPRRRRRLRSLTIALIALIAVGAGLVGCGSTPKNTNSTPGAYVITVNATAGTITTQSTIALTVQ